MSEPSKKPNLKEAYRELAPWKRRLHLVALVLVVLGLGMKGLSLATGGGGGSEDSGGIVSGNPRSEVATKSGGALDPTGNAFLPTPTPTGKTGESSPGPGIPVPEGGGGDSSGGDEGGEAFLEEWSPTMVRGGLSFFAAFWIGFALRTFARICGLFVGLFALGVLTLQQMGWVTVEWAVAQEQFAALPGFLGEQFSGFRTFLQGSLPSAGMAAVGLYAGLKRR